MSNDDFVLLATLLINGYFKDLFKGKRTVENVLNQIDGIIEFSSRKELIEFFNEEVNYYSETIPEFKKYLIPVEED